MIFSIAVEGPSLPWSAGKYNDLATAFLANPDETIKHIFSLGRLSRRYEVCAGSNW